MKKGFDSLMGICPIFFFSSTNRAITQRDYGTLMLEKEKFSFFRRKHYGYQQDSREEEIPFCKIQRLAARKNALE